MVLFTAELDGSPTLEGAVALLTECVKREPDHPLYRLGLAYAHMARETWDTAAEQFDAALELASKR